MIATRLDLCDVSKRWNASIICSHWLRERTSETIHKGGALLVELCALLAHRRSEPLHDVVAGGKK